MSAPTIRVVNYCGDRDDLNAIHVIGPYATPADRDRDIHRLTHLPDVYGSLEFEASTIPPDAAERSCGPEDVADAADLEQVLNALAGYRPTEPSTVPDPTLPGL